MSAADNQKETTEPDNVDVGLIATITVVGALLVVAIAAALTALVRVEQGRYQEEAGAYADLGAVHRLKRGQDDKLNAPPKWADKANGLVSIPIDRAMNLVTSDIQKNPALATPIPPDDEEQPDGGAEGGADAGASEEGDEEGAGGASGPGSEGQTTEQPVPEPRQPAPAAPEGPAPKSTPATGKPAPQKPAPAVPEGPAPKPTSATGKPAPQKGATPPAVPKKEPVPAPPKAPPAAVPGTAPTGGQE